MSLKRRAKVEHGISPKSVIQRQIDESFRLNMQANKENSTEQYLLCRMQQKIGKILAAYQKLEDECQKKDDLIKDLERQNLLLKQRVVDLSAQKSNLLNKTISRRQPFEQHVVQRTFTPSDIKKQIKLHSQTMNYKSNNDFSSPAVSIVRQYDGRTPMNRLLRESRSLENIHNLPVNKQRQFLSSNMIAGGVANVEENKLFSKLDENRPYKQEPEEDRSFIDILGKLKEKIKKFDQEEQAQLSRKTIEKESKIKAQRASDNLHRVKSSQNINRRQFSFMDKPEEVQTQTLKKIWNQRDEEIKRMNELFSKIDQRIHVIQMN